MKILGFPKFLLQSPQQFFLLTFFEEQIIVCQVGKLLLELTGDLIPVSLNVELFI